MYLGFAIVLLAWALALGELLPSLGVVGFVLYIQWFQITPEELALQQRFGESFSFSRAVCAAGSERAVISINKTATLEHCSRVCGQELLIESQEQSTGCIGRLYVLVSSQCMRRTISYRYEYFKIVILRSSRR